MTVTPIPSGLGRVCGAVIRARTIATGVFDIVIAERGLVLVPISAPRRNPASGFLMTGIEGGILGYRRNVNYDERRRENYLATSADELARHFLSHQVVRRGDVANARVWDHGGNGKLRIQLNDGTSTTLRWERHANREFDVAALMLSAFGPVVDVRAAHSHAA
jgi:hypothetical protein